MNIVVIPFHDWRKILLEGFRTRDAHFIEEFNKNKNFIKVIINRPTTLLEITLKRKRNLIKGKVVLSKSNFKLYEVEENLYVIDYVSNNIFSQVINGYKWFINQYNSQKYVAFINECFKHLGIENDYHLLSQNIFAYKLFENLKPKTAIFDAWDNFAKFKVYSAIIENIEFGYQTYAKSADLWITNSNDNIIDFDKKYQPKRIYLIKNGVDVTRFIENKNEDVPFDLKDIPRPIIGFGGKITQLIDVELLNETMELTPNSSFVFVGQNLDKQIFNSIKKLQNFHYLGDKHYDDYPKYVKNFDICIVPYVVDTNKKSGANSIKVYEYLSTNKKVVGTNSNGLEDLSEHLYIVNNAKEFALTLSCQVNNKTPIKLSDHSWGNKIIEFVGLLNET